ncbi:MAG: hypothetical protein AAFP02_20380, partial [Bacteroidota bacterium]
MSTPEPSTPETPTTNRFGFVPDLIDAITPDPLEDAFDEVVNLAEAYQEEVQNLAHVLADTAVELALNGPGLIKDQIEAITKEGFEVALSALNGDAITVLKDNATNLTNYKNWTPSNIANGAATLTKDMMNAAYDNAKAGFDIITQIAEYIYKLLLIRLARRYVGSVQELLVSLANVITSVPAAFSKIKAGITDGDPSKVLEGIGDLTKNTPFKTIITQLQNLDAGSLIISVEGSVASGVEANKSIGIAISLEALDHMATNQGALTGFDGPIMSFISTAGIAIFSAGGGGDIVIGYDVGKPDDVDGFGIDVSLSLKAKAGGSVSVGLDPISSFPPDLTSVAVGVGGGASIEASVGASYTT